MKKHLFFVILFLFVSCESDTENKHTEFTGGLVILNQETWPSSSTLTHFESTSNTTSQSAFHSANNKDLGASGNQIDLYGDYIYITVATAGKVRILNKNLSEVATVEAFESGFYPQYLTVINSQLYTVWTNYSKHVLTLHDVSTAKITSDAVTLEDSIGVPSYNPVINDGLSVYSWSGNTLYKVTESSGVLAITKKELSIRPTDLAHKNSKIFASFANYQLTGENGDASRTRTSTGGVVSYTSDINKIDSVYYSEGVFKLGSYSTGLFAISVSGTQNGEKNNWGGYNWSNDVETNMNVIENNSFKRLFSSNKLGINASSTWVRFKYIDETESFSIPEFLDYVSNGKINLFRLDGSIQRTIDAGVAPVNSVYIK